VEVTVTPTAWTALVTVVEAGSMDTVNTTGVAQSAGLTVAVAGDDTILPVGENCAHTQTHRHGHGHTVPDEHDAQRRRWQSNSLSLAKPHSLPPSLPPPRQAHG
jgi:hypothetical protein